MLPVFWLSVIDGPATACMVEYRPPPATSERKNDPITAKDNTGLCIGSASSPGIRPTNNIGFQYNRSIRSTQIAHETTTIKPKPAGS
jgi:hypothetical protein